MQKAVVGSVCALTAIFASYAMASLVTVGKQGSVVAYPFRGNAGVDAVRCQDLVLASELRPSKANPVIIIRRWEWFASASVSAGYFNNFTIKLCHTGYTALTANFEYNYGRFKPVTVYGKSAQYLNPKANDWFGFDFPIYYWDGHSNLIVEVEWRGDTGGFAYTYWSAGTARCVFNYNGGRPVVRDYVHYMRVTIHFIPGVEPTSLGRVRALYL
ncbi:MAG: hypothetical protein GTN49_01530 [candidate division Zixibacteria bacterium]|nr:hypothetical protein [candidate division Zixibacteria bacterium]